MIVSNGRPVPDVRPVFEDAWWDGLGEPGDGRADGGDERMGREGEDEEAGEDFVEKKLKVRLFFFLSAVSDEEEALVDTEIVESISAGCCIDVPGLTAPGSSLTLNSPVTGSSEYIARPPPVANGEEANREALSSKDIRPKAPTRSKSGLSRLSTRTVGRTECEGGRTGTSWVAMTTRECLRAGDAQMRAWRSGGGGALSTRTVVFWESLSASRSRTQGTSPNGLAGSLGRKSMLEGRERRVARPWRNCIIHEPKMPMRRTPESVRTRPVDRINAQDQVPAYQMSIPGHVTVMSFPLFLLLLDEFSEDVNLCFPSQPHPSATRLLKSPLEHHQIAWMRSLDFYLHPSLKSIFIKPLQPDFRQ